MREENGLVGKRIGKTVLCEVERFIDWFEDWTKEFNITGDGMMNADETRITIQGGQRKQKTAEATDKRKPGVIELPAAYGATYVPFVLATGEMCCSFFVVPTRGKDTVTIKLHRVRRDQEQHPTFFTFTESGWVDGATWLLMLKQMLVSWQTLRRKTTLCLLVDNLRAHMTPEVLKWCHESQLQLVFFPKYATQFIQPCDDDLIFATFKKRFRTVMCCGPELLDPRGEGPGRPSPLASTAPRRRNHS